MENVASREDEDGAQAIIIAAFLVAIGILVLSVLLNGLIFSQNLATRDEGADERRILEVNQGTQEAVHTAMTGNRTTPADAEDEFDLFMNLYEEELVEKYSGRQAAVSLGPTGSDSDLNFSDLSSGTRAWALGQRCDLDDSTTDCRLENATDESRWNAIEDNTGSAGNAFDSPHRFVFTVERPSPSADTFQVDAVRNENAERNFDFFSSDTTEGDWRMTVDNSKIEFEKVDSVLLPPISAVLTNDTTVDWSAVDGDRARIDVLNESINGKDVASIGSSGVSDATSTYSGELDDTDKNYMRFWNGSEVKGEYDIRLNDATLENDITGPCDAPCSETGERGIYAFGVIHEVDGVRASYTSADTTHTTEIGATLRQEDLILEERSMDREKAITVTTGFVINLGIATTLIAIMFFLFQGIFIEVQDQTAGSEMRIVGEKISTELQKADRLAQKGNGTIEMDLPQFEQAYRVNITGDKKGKVILRSRATEVAVNYSVSSDITNDGYGNSAGGRIVMEYRNVGDGEIDLR